MEGEHGRAGKGQRLVSDDWTDLLKSPVRPQAPARMQQQQQAVCP